MGRRVFISAFRSSCFSASASSRSCNGSVTESTNRPGANRAGERDGGSVERHIATTHLRLFDPFCAPSRPRSAEEAYSRSEQKSRSGRNEGARGVPRLRRVQSLLATASTGG